MKKVLMGLSLLLSARFVDAQNQPDQMLYDKYNALNYTAYDYLRAAETYKWQPSKEGVFKGSLPLFEKVFLRLDDNDLHQLKIDGCYYCALEHKYLMERYNRRYKGVSVEIWFEKCPLLYTLMHYDESL